MHKHHNEMPPHVEPLKNTMENVPQPISPTVTEPKDQHVFSGKPDSRQSFDVNMVTSRFRPNYRPLTDSEKRLHDSIKAKAVELEDLFNQIPQGRYLSLGFTDLESAVMWAIKQLTQ